MELIAQVLVLKLCVISIYEAVEAFPGGIGAHREGRDVLLLDCVHQLCPGGFPLGRAAVVAVQYYVVLVHSYDVGVASPEPDPQGCGLVALMYCHSYDSVVARLGALCYPAAKDAAPEELGKALQLLGLPDPACMAVEPGGAGLH